MHRLLVVISAAVFVASAASANDAPFPRLATNWLSHPNYEDPAIQQQLARGDIAVIVFWPGWESGRGTTIEQVVRNVKGINPRTQVFAYILNEAIPLGRPPYAEIYPQLDTNSWYLYPAGVAGTPVDSFFGSGHVTLNNTLFGRKNSNGDGWVDWYAKWAVQKYFVPNPSLDGFFLDNVFWRPRVNGDWNLDGVTDSSSNPTVAAWQRQGLRRHFDLMRQLMPNKYQIGNTADWGVAEAVFPELDQQLNGGLMEGLIGYSWSFETWGGWAEMMRAYRKIIGAYAEPKLGIFHQVGSPTDYQAFRYGFASCLLDDGYYAFNTSEAYSDAPVFDEYQTDLGAALGAPVTSAWQNGIYRRDFENGIVLVNPKGNGARTVQLESDFRKISGTQAPSVNNGQVTRSVALNDRDGIVLLRLNAVPKPGPPTLFVQ